AARAALRDAPQLRGGKRGGGAAGPHKGGGKTTRAPRPPPPPHPPSSGRRRQPQQFFAPPARSSPPGFQHLAANPPLQLAHLATPVRPLGRCPGPSVPPGRRAGAT